MYATEHIAEVCSCRRAIEMAKELRLKYFVVKITDDGTGERIHCYETGHMEVCLDGII